MNKCIKITGKQNIDKMFNSDASAVRIESIANIVDEKWLVHSLAWLDNNGKVTMGTRQVHMNPLTNQVQSIPPKKRVY